MLLTVQTAEEEKSLPAGLRERKRMRTRNAILVSAWSLFTRDGIANTTIKAIAELAEVSDVTIYSYFETREALIDAVVSDESRARETDAALLARPSSEGPLEAFRAVADSEEPHSKAEVRRSIKIFKTIQNDPVLHGAWLHRQAVRAIELADVLRPRAKAKGMSDLDLLALCRLLTTAGDMFNDGLTATEPTAWDEGQDQFLDRLAIGWGTSD